jgi:hypothetical protein
MIEIYSFADLYVTINAELERIFGFGGSTWWGRFLRCLARQSPGESL